MQERSLQMKTLSDALVTIDDFVWGPVMLVLLVGTGIFLTIRTKALCWRNLPYALRSVLSKEARQKTGDGDVSPFSALTTALAATSAPETLSVSPPPWCPAVRVRWSGCGSPRCSD